MFVLVQEPCANEAPHLLAVCFTVPLGTYGRALRQSMDF